MRDLSQPIPTRASKASVFDFAERTAQKLGFGAGDSIHKLVEKLGGRIEVSDPFAETIDETIRVEGKRDFTIFVSSFTSGRRDRFTIAHELGHYLLHYPRLLKTDSDARMFATRWVDESDDDQRRAEWEANWFAAALLMPDKEFREQYRALKDLNKVADHFGVSNHAAEIRAKSLGLL